MKDFNKEFQTELNQRLIDGVKHGHLDIVKYVLTSPNLSHHADIHSNDDIALAFACGNNHFHVVKYLLSSPDLLIPDAQGHIMGHAHIRAEENRALEWAVESGNLHIVKYLLTSPDLLLPDSHGNIVGHADMHDTSDDIVMMACMMEHLEIVDYLLTSPELNHLPPLNLHEGRIFFELAQRENIKVLQHLIFHHNLQETSNVNYWKTGWDNPEINRLFALRDLNNTLSDELTQQNTKKHYKI